MRGPRRDGRWSGAIGVVGSGWLCGGAADWLSGFVPADGLLQDFLIRVAQGLATLASSVNFLGAIPVEFRFGKSCGDGNKKENERGDFHSGEAYK